jgi:hypothetical protein
MAWRRLAFIGLVGFVASLFVNQAILIGHFNEARWLGASIPGALLGTLPALLGSAAVFIPIAAAILLLYVVLIVPLTMRRMGRDRRALTYEIDEAGIRTKDALGAELVLPWSNIKRLIFRKRILLLRLRPAGWRYLPLRAFAPDDRTRVGELAVRMVGSPSQKEGLR